MSFLQDNKPSWLSEVKTSLLQYWRSISIRDKMKTKNFYIALFAFVICTFVSLWLLSNPTPNFNTIVTQTHKQISNIKNIPENIRSSSSEDFVVDQSILAKLGFEFVGSSSVSTSKSDTDTPHQQITLPIIVTPAFSGQQDNVRKLIKSVALHLPDKTVLVYDLGLGGFHLQKLKSHCNTTKNCFVKKFDFAKYPSHVKHLDLRSFRPVLIQEALNDYGFAIYTETPEVFITGQINKLLKKAQNVGIVAWTDKEPVSSITYHKMFKYFQTKVENYFFLETAKANHLIIYNTKKMHKEVMFPWVKCALSEDCINPTGAQNVVCNQDRKPLYLYAGCHKYDTSALNVILGKVFEYDDSLYKTTEEIFGSSTTKVDLD